MILDEFSREYLRRIHRLLYPHQKQLLRVALVFYLVSLGIVVLLRWWDFDVLAWIVTVFALANLVACAAWLAVPPPGGSTDGSSTKAR